MAVGITEGVALAVALVTAIGVLAEKIGGRRQQQAAANHEQASAGLAEAEAESVSVGTMEEVVQRLHKEMEGIAERHEAEVRRLNEVHEARMESLRAEHDRVLADRQRIIDRLRDQLSESERLLGEFRTALEECRGREPDQEE